MSEDTFISHLVELRDRLIRALVAVGVVTLILSIWPGIGGVYDFLARPMTQALPEGARMIATGVVSPVFVPLKVTVLAAFLLALPYVLYQMWAFVAPGLYAHEKRVALPLVVMSTVLFFLGIAYCYFVVFGLVFHAIQSFAPQAITPAPDIEAYLSFVTTMFLAFGITFEIPLLQLVLVRTGAVTVEKLKDVRGYVIVGAFVVAAVVTPPDMLSQLLLALPMCVLYQLGIIAAGFLRPRQAAESDAYASDELDKVEPNSR
ncbi:MAG TPA: twin-arginine translocase subunit TatC [Burkholderiales bacterium]|jgi:sec-independent protein translocase protein TatC|nr:twin-arginine translocase subunit TatC [Burkholderiales bacterium]